MSFDTLLVILLIWTVAGLLAAIAFGKAVQQASPDEESLASSAGSVKYIRRNKDKVRDTSVRVSGSRHGTKHTSS
jgi:hypothetical protein